MTNNEALIAELTAMLNQQQDDDQDGLTKWEIIEATGWPQNKTHRTLRVAVEQGIIEAAGGYRWSPVLKRSCWTILYRICKREA